ncbi:MAG: chalcone isomerase family protein [Bacteroidota bacterium]
MKKIILVLFLSCNLSIFSQKTVTIENVEFFKSIKVGGENLIVNGGGLREKYWIDLYVAALYLKNKSSEASKIIQKDEEMAIYIKLVSDKVTREKFLETVKEGFANSTAGKATKEEIKKFTGFFTDEFKNGDKIYLEYIPNKGVQVKKNGKNIGEIESLEFKKALFSIWLGSKTPNVDLKNGMLGKDN